MQAPPHNYQTDIKERNSGPVSEFGERLFLHILTFSVPTSSSVFDLSYLTLHSYIQLICSNCAAIVLREPTAFVCKSNP